MGGRHKGGDLGPLREALSKSHDRAVLIGEAAAQMAELLTGSVPFTMASDMGHAVEVAAEQAGSSGTVLLAPACASFDMFRNFEHRGECFREEVKARFGRPTRNGNGNGSGHAPGRSAA
jgi:UDP-N-acetylmuramoylalanine--D-glutamate ligase